MAAGAFNITIHMVSSLDGYIAKKDNNINWFETADNYEDGLTVTAQDAAEFLKAIDCYIMGSHTYEHALELSKTYGWPYGDVPVIVLTQRQLPVERESVEFYKGSLANLVNELLKPNFHNVWVAGGASLANNFIRLNLADEIRLSVLPVILGDGLTFLQAIGKEQPLHLLGVTAYKSGMVELQYQIKK